DVSNIDIKNNIFFVKANNYGNARLIQSYGTVSNISSDYNLLYSDRFHINFDNTDYDSLAAWQSTGNGTNSRSFEPEFVDLDPYSDVHLGYCSLGDSSLWGIPLLGVTVDYDGNPRDPFNPYIGADEVDSFRPDIFTPVNLTSVQDKALSFATGDLDNDGDDDLVVVNTYTSLGGSEDLSIFWNDGQGNFSSPVHLSMGVEPTVVKIWDIDSDGFLDLIATTNSASGMPVMRWGQGNGAFSAPLELPPYPFASLGRVTDLDFHTPPKFLTLAHFGTVGVDSGWVSFCIFDSATRWFFYYVTPGYEPRRAGKHPANIANVDVNGDTLVDIVVNDWVTGKTTTFEYLGITEGIARLQEIDVDIGTDPIHANMAVGDINGDNFNDVVIGSWVDGVDSLVWLRNDGAGNLNLDYIPMDARRPSQTFSLMDYENDGDEDIISATTSDDVILYRNDGVGNFTIQRLCQSSEYGGLALTSLVGDFNNDPYPDVAVLTQDNIATMLNLNYIVGVGDEDPEPLSIIPEQFTLEQNYPNPFNPVTNLRFRIAEFGFVELKIYDLLGREVKTLVNEQKSPGTYTVQWDGTNDAGQSVASGVYLYRLVVGQASPTMPGQASRSFMQTRKMVLMR
ncbi:MAG: FG-GAP-like repeat-containing protein, partial [Calditrichia bacterium]